MKKNRISPMALALLCVSLLGGCGGGGDDQAGSVTEFSVQPADLTVTGAVGACAAGGPFLFFVYGGTAPYHLDNPAPLYITLDKGQVDQRGGSFGVTFLGGCLDPGSVIITDALGKQVTVKLTNQKGT